MRSYALVWRCCETSRRAQRSALGRSGNQWVPVCVEAISTIRRTGVSCISFLQHTPWCSGNGGLCSTFGISKSMVRWLRSSYLRDKKIPIVYGRNSIDYVRIRMTCWAVDG